MEFGKLSNIENVNWTLPVDSALSLNYLRSQPQQSTQYFIGAPAWGHKEWIGKIYPPGAKSSDFLHYYSRYFNCIELNTSHYRIPPTAQATSWLAQVPKDFLFLPKVFKGISHSHDKLDHNLLQAWWKFLADLKPNLGPCFLQLPPLFTYAHKAWLFQLLKVWPREFELALEFRHSSWFADGQILPALTEYLQSQNVGLVITDVAGRRDVLHTTVSSSFSMLRFIGNDLHPTDETRAAEWIKKFRTWSKAGLQRMYFIVHEPDDVHTIEMTELILAHFKDALANWVWMRNTNVDLRGQLTPGRSEQLTFDSTQLIGLGKQAAELNCRTGRL